MEMGIDVGYSSTKIVILEKGSIVFRHIVERQSMPKLEMLVKDVMLRHKGIKHIGITGGKSNLIKLRLNMKPGSIKHVNEIDAIGNGGLFLAKKSKAVIVSCGTGTCIVFAEQNSKNKNFLHIGGTGVGGGTILGLSEKLLSTHDIKKIERLANKGFLSKVDLQVGDIVGEGIGVLPKNITASNFGKLAMASKEDTAKGILNMVAEVIATTSIFGAKSAGEHSIYLAGRVSKINYVNSRISVIGKLFKTNFHRLKDAEYATAVGAALLAR